VIGLDRVVWDILLMVKGRGSCKPRVVMWGTLRRFRERYVSGTAEERLFYRVFLPLGVLANLGLGIWLLAGLKPQIWSDWLMVVTGAFCCLVAGWLAASAWSMSYWSRAMARQVAAWRRIADTFFAWLEDAPLPPEALHRLKTSLDESVTQVERR
jgi:hypothetical protein